MAQSSFGKRYMVSALLFVQMSMTHFMLLVVDRDDVLFG